VACRRAIWFLLWNVYDHFEVISQGCSLHRDNTVFEDHQALWESVLPPLSLPSF
jgi:hypothetical protein